MKLDTAQQLRPASAAPGTPARLLVVASIPAHAAELAGMLNDRYRVQAASSGTEAQAQASVNPPDLILLDTVLPGMDAYAICRQLKADPLTAAVPVLFLTDPTRNDDARQGFEAGGADHVARPWHPMTLLARIATQLQLGAWRAAQRGRGAAQDEALQARLQEVDALRDATLFVMVSFAEFRDDDSGNHVRRTQEYVRTMAQWLQGLGDVRYALSPAQIDQIACSAPLHDIGKVAIPDGILLKPGRLTPEEFTIMKTHARRGYDLLQRAAERMGEDGQRYLRPAMDIARHHHERWDGSGYPDGLAGQAIPLSARLMAVADVYDALISRRPYKGPVDPDEAQRLIADQAGHHFDPTVVMAMQATLGQIAEIAARWPD